MTPGLVNFVCPQGSDFVRTITYIIDDVPVDVSGYSARMQVRSAHYSETTLVNIDSGELGGIIVGGSEGTFDLHILAEDTAAIPAGTHVYDLEIVSSSGIVDRLIEGSFVVTPEVTR